VGQTPAGTGLKLAAAVAFAAIATLPKTVAADNLDWAGQPTSNWEDLLTWYDPSLVSGFSGPPTAGDNAFIDAGAGGPALTGSGTVNSLYVGYFVSGFGQIQPSGFGGEALDISTAGRLDASGSVYLNAGLSDDGNLNVAGSIHDSAGVGEGVDMGGTISGNGSLAVGGSIDLDNGGDISIGGSLNANSINLQDFSSVSVGGNASVMDGVTLDSGTLNFNGDSSVGGAVTAVGGGTIFFGGNATIGGSISLTDSTLKIGDGGSVSALGPVSVGSQASGAQGSILVFPSGQLSISGDLSVLPASVVGVSGTIQNQSAYVYGGVEIIGTDSSWVNSGQLHVDGGYVEVGDQATGSSTDAILGGSNGELDVEGTGSNWTASGNLYVGSTSSGDAGSGALVVANGAWVSAEGNIAIDNGSSATVSGVAVDPGAPADNQPNTLSTGDNGTLSVIPELAGASILTISGGASVSDAHGFIGFLDEGGGLPAVVSVSGHDTGWENTADLNVQGNLSITDGGEVFSAGNVTIGEINSDPALAAPNGLVIVSGSDSASNPSTLNIGATDETPDQGKPSIATTGGAANLTIYGGLTIEQGGVVNNTDGNIPTGGSVIVQDANSRWNCAGNLHVGTSGSAALLLPNFGAGSLRIQNGAAVSVDGNITIDGGAAVTVKGPGVDSGESADNQPGALSTETGTMFVGDSGSGSLIIKGGANVSDGNASIGVSAPGVGYTSAVLVTDPGSVWDTAGGLNISLGNLTIQNQADVSDANATLGPGSVATVSGGTWSNSSAMTVGSGAVTLMLGGTFVTTPGAMLNVNSGGSVSAGTLTVVGSSEIILGGNAIIPGGSVSISSGSEITAGTAFIYSGATVAINDGTLSASGLMTVAGNLTIQNTGMIGAGTLEIQPGGAATIGASAVLRAGSIQIGDAADRSSTTATTGLNNGGLGLLRLTNDPAIVASQIQNEGTIVGHFSLAGNLTNDGLLDVSGGGAIGVDSINGSLKLESDSIVRLEAVGAAAGDYDQIQVQVGEVVIGGELDLEFVNGYAPRKGDTFKIATGDCSGAFSQIEADGIGPGWQYSVQTDSSGVVITSLNDASLPEPSSASLTALCAGSLLARRRRA